MKTSRWPKGSRQSRGYGPEWDRRRKRILERDNHLCQCERCKAESRATPANEVDHKVSKANARARGWTDEQIESDDNLQAINHDCHKRKTQEEQGKVKRERRAVGLDGFPK